MAGLLPTAAKVWCLPVRSARTRLHIGNYGRSERIRTSGPCVPNTVLYQAELHSDAGSYGVAPAQGPAIYLPTPSRASGVLTRKGRVKAARDAAFGRT